MHVLAQDWFMNQVPEEERLDSVQLLAAWNRNRSELHVASSAQVVWVCCVQCQLSQGFYNGENSGWSPNRPLLGGRLMRELTARRSRSR